MLTHLCPRCKVTQVQNNYTYCSCCDQKRIISTYCSHPFIKCSNCGKPTVKDKGNINPTYCYICQQQDAFNKKEKEMLNEDLLTTKEEEREAPQKGHCAFCDRSDVFIAGHQIDTDKLICIRCAKEEKDRPSNWAAAAYRANNPLCHSISDSFDKAMKLVISKNQDYAGTKDPLANFRAVENTSITDMITAILVRMSDKWTRICNLHNKGFAAVKDETIEDTLLDLMNYCAILIYARKVQTPIGATNISKEDYDKMEKENAKD